MKQVNRMIDVSAVRADATWEEIDEMISIVKEYNCICASPMPWATEYTIKQLKDYPETVVTGVVSFPSGAETTDIKVKMTKSLIEMGCKEIDMVMNISAFLSGHYEYVQKDIEAVVNAAAPWPTKVIIEVAYLTDDQIIKASQLIMDAKAAFVKTGTGWANKPTEARHIELIKNVVKDNVKIKAAGGIRSIDDVEAMYKLGCNRFGLGVRTATKILK